MAKTTLNTLYHGVFNLQVHLVVATKFRARCLTGEMLARFREIAAATAERWKCELHECNGESDHVHLLLGLNPKIAPCEFVNNLKTTSSRLLRKEYADHLKKHYWNHAGLWSRSYCLLSVGGAPLSVLNAYIEQQDRPH